MANIWRVDMADLAITLPNAGIETVQSRIQPPLADRLRQRYGAPDLVVARMILEHTSDPSAFLETVRSLVHPAGYVVLDVPDCGRALDCLDYTTLWEDHALYFVEETFHAACGWWLWREHSRSPWSLRELPGRDSTPPTRPEGKPGNDAVRGVGARPPLR
jgi:hypothetical protein